MSRNIKGGFLTLSGVVVHVPLSRKVFLGHEYAKIPIHKPIFHWCGQSGILVTLL